MRKLLCLLFLALLCAAAVPSCAEGVSRALLIGCDDFVTMNNTAQSSRNSVMSMAQVLGGGSLNTDVIITRSTGIASSDELAELIRYTFRSADAQDTSYFYLSTHGLWSPGMSSGEMVFVLSDGRAEDAVTAAALRTMLDTVPGRKVLLLDACHSGAVIGKGVSDAIGNVFSGPDYVVVCSSGGAEESWLWSGYGPGGEPERGAGYFSAALVTAMSAEGGFAADVNRNGEITLNELKNYLRSAYGVSTVQTYPEESGFVLMTYDAESYSLDSTDRAIVQLCFEEGAISLEDPSVSFSFTVRHSTRLAYQLVSRENDRWSFDNAIRMWDEGTPGREPGTLQPGYYERTITLSDLTDEDEYGGCLLQLITVDEGRVEVLCSRLICVLPTEGDPALSVSAPESFDPASGEELTFNVLHALPCELTVTIETPDGDVLRRICSSQPTRPEQLDPAGSSFTWSGLLADGSIAEAGSYVIHARTRLGGVVYEAYSQPITITGADSSQTEAD